MDKWGHAHIYASVRRCITSGVWVEQDESALWSRLNLPSLLWCEIKEPSQNIRRKIGAASEAHEGFKKLEDDQNSCPHVQVWWSKQVHPGANGKTLKDVLKAPKCPQWTSSRLVWTGLTGSRENGDKDVCRHVLRTHQASVGSSGHQNRGHVCQRSSRSCFCCLTAARFVFSSDFKKTKVSE